MDIENYEIVRPKLIANNVKIVVKNIELFKCACIQVLFINKKILHGMEEITYLYDDEFKISGFEYDKWSNDDRYIENLVIQKYGLKRV